MPSGEQFSEQRDIWATPYKFNGKELDAETGLYYYGARYYTPEIGIWLSVDPLSDKCPHQSNYMYCSGRLVNVIDPDGRDEWEFDEAGNMLNRIENKNQDSFHIIKNGKRSERNSISFSSGTVLEQSSVNYQDNSDKDKPIIGVDYFKIKGDENSQKAFEFFAKNTSSEWSQILTGNQEGEQGLSYLTTSCNGTLEAGAAYFGNKEKNIRGVNHNHPYPYEGLPSSNDKMFADAVMKTNGKNAFFNVYYFPFGKNADGVYVNFNNTGLTGKGYATRAAINHLRKY